MNKKWKETKKNVKGSPVLFDDEEMGTTSIDEVKVKSSATPRSKRFTDHSTPIGHKIAIDSPELNYNESPIVEPLTQHPPSEVGWDYKQFLKDDEDGNSHIPMDTGTPKRSTNLLLSKKRNSNSPLLYKPVKKKLIQDQQRESMEDFMVVLKQIECNAKQKKDNDEDTKKTENSIESQLIVDMDVASDESDMKLQVSAHTDESPGHISNEIVRHKNYHALLDDSIEDMMVLCSQEVEAKEFAANKNQNDQLCTIQEKSSETSCNESLEKVLRNPAKENIQPSNDKAINVSDISSKNSSKSNKSESLEIPDDSFDDFFVTIDDKDLCKNAEIYINDKNKTVKTHNKPPTKLIQDSLSKSSEQKKFFQWKSSGHAEPKNVTSITSNKHIKTSLNPRVSVQTKVINEKASYGYLNKDYMKNSNSSISNPETQISTTTNETRLFKAKSFSDSNFLQQNHHVHSLDRSRSNLNINSMSHQNLQSMHCLNKNSEDYGSSSSSSENQGWRRTNSSSSIGSSQLSGLNRLTNSEGTQSTPEEIARKRQDAINRRQQKMANRKNNSAALLRPVQQPIKR